MKHHLDEPFDAAQPALIVTYGNTAQKSRPLDRDLIVVGRGRTCDIGLASPEVADIHCLLLRTPDGWHVRDCGSRVGTRLNGQLVLQAQLLDGDALQVGTFLFRVHLPCPAPKGQPRVESERELHLRKARRRLIHLALRLRRRLREQRAGEGSVPAALREREAAVARHLEVLQARLHDSEVRAGRLQQAERDLARDRLTLERERDTFQARSTRLEQEFTQRQAEAEADLRRRREGWEEYCRQVEREWEERRQQPVAIPAALEAETRQLQLRSAELAYFAQHLRRVRLRLDGEYRQEGAPHRQDEAPPPAGSDTLADEETSPEEQLALLTHRLQEVEERRERDITRLEGELATLRQENEQMHQGLDAAHAQRKPRSDSGLVRRDLEQYEAELNDLERELRREREALTEEVRQVQARTTEVEEIARATEVAMSQERAKLAREQTDLNRLRDEIRLEQDRKQRHVSLRNRLASLQP
jgi:hypothetical protein